MIKCDYCGNEFTADEAKNGCGACRGGCHAVHCPRCGYMIPREPNIIKKIKGLFSKNMDKRGDGE